MRRSLDVYETLPDAPAWVIKRIEAAPLAVKALPQTAYIVVVRVGHRWQQMDFDFVQSFVGNRAVTILRGERVEDDQVVYLIHTVGAQ